MSISYPNGKKYLNRMTLSKQINKTFANRGMTLEDDLNNTNHFYLETGRAAIYKKPTPVQIVNVSYPKRSAAVIKEAYFKQPSTTDYNGIYKGKYIDFEAKETKNKTSFPLNNFHEHQVAHMKRIMTHGGIGFIIIRFSMTDEIYLLENQHLISYWEKQHHGGRKSIPKEYISKHGFSIKIGFSPRIDYLDVIDTIYFKDHNN